jgi:hypothetical protein
MQALKIVRPADRVEHHCIEVGHHDGVTIPSQYVNGSIPHRAIERSGLWMRVHEENVHAFVVPFP